MPDNSPKIDSNERLPSQVSAAFTNVTPLAADALITSPTVLLEPLALSITTKLLADKPLCAVPVNVDTLLENASINEGAPPLRIAVCCT